MVDAALEYLGSPPRMRGKEIISTVTSGCVRITPAHAGKSEVSFYKGEVKRDHPRACGEKLKILIPLLSRKGSPPRMRGKDRSPYSANCEQGITPAHAGKSVWE